MRDIYGVVDRWGVWAATDNSGVYWQPIAAGFKGLLPYGKHKRLSCCDDDGMIIDSCVLRLKKFDYNEFELIVAHFVMGVSLRAIAKKNKCSDGTVRKRLQNALGFINGVIEVSGAKLTME